VLAAAYGLAPGISKRYSDGSGLVAGDGLNGGSVGDALKTDVAEELELGV